MSKMSLSNVKKGIQQAPPRVVLYGVEGVGKSTFAAGAPSPIFLGAEDGTSQLDVARFPEPTTWADALAAVDVLTLEDHDYQTFVIDTLDWLEPLCWAHVCAANGVSSIEDVQKGFGKGYLAALSEWRILLSRIDNLRAKRGMSVILLAHSVIKPFNNPEAENYDRYELKLQKLASGLVKEWTDALLFARHETFTAGGAKGAKVKGVSTGARVVHTEHSAAWDAKTRYSHPETIALDWADFAQGMRAADPAAIRAEIVALLPSVEDETIRANVDKWLNNKDLDAVKLTAGLNKIKVRLASAPEKESKSS